MRMWVLRRALRFLLAVAISVGCYMMLQDVMIVKWKVQRQVAPETWPWLVFHYVIIIQIALTILIGLGVSPIHSMLVKYPVATRWWVASYYLLVGILLGSWITLTQLLAMA